MSLAKDYKMASSSIGAIIAESFTPMTPREDQEERYPCKIKVSQMKICYGVGCYHAKTGDCVAYNAFKMKN